MTLLLFLVTSILNNCIYPLQSRLAVEEADTGLMPPLEDFVGPDVGIALTYAPDPVVVGDDVRFSIWMSTGLAASGGTVVVGIEEATLPMTSMEMTGDLVGAVEQEPGKYALGVKFEEEGDFIIHVHFVPVGMSTMEMMRNHADFGPLRVYSSTHSIALPRKVDVQIAANAYDPNHREGFVPEVLMVSAGTTVTWKNFDASSHTITESEMGLFTSPLINPGESWSYTFNEPGVYLYHCNPHPWMVGASR